MTTSDQHPELGPLRRHGPHIATVVRFHTRQRRLGGWPLHYGSGSLIASAGWQQTRGAVIRCAGTGQTPPVVDGGGRHLWIEIAVFAVGHFEHWNIARLTSILLKHQIAMRTTINMLCTYENPLDYDTVDIADQRSSNTAPY